MQPDFVKGSLLLEIGWATLILVIYILLAWGVTKLIRYIQNYIEHHTKKSALAPQLIESISRPLLVFIILDGLLLALGTLSFMQTWVDVLRKIGIVVVIALLTYAAANILASLLAWYMRNLRTRRKARFDEGLIRFTRRILYIIVLAIGILIILDYLNIEISPIIAGLGIGGLAVALALQPTLGNFFASTQIISDRVVKVGDYIELEDPNVRGYVTDVGWRSTRIRTPFNNMIIIPNSRLADSIITNYFGPTMDMIVQVNCGVSYNADLQKVEQVSLEVAKEITEELEETVKDFEPMFRFEEFGDSNINFWIWLSAKDRIATFKVRSELIKRLKSRLDKEGIMINYPARLLTFEKPDTDTDFLKDKKKK
jgi:small-conductance mechanosensitive channel